MALEFSRAQNSHSLDSQSLKGAQRGFTNFLSRVAKWGCSGCALHQGEILFKWDHVMEGFHLFASFLFLFQLC